MTILKDEKIKQAFGQDGPYKDKNLKAVFYNKFAPISPKTLYDADAERAYRDQIAELAIGKTDLNTAFRVIEETVNKAVAEKMQQ
jgi:multiple sugar transport system substrate-binding protein